MKGPENLDHAPDHKDDEFQVVVFGSGLMPTFVISSEKIRRIEEAEEKRRQEKEKSGRPSHLAATGPGWAGWHLAL
jgi:hypothetical protein